MEYLDLFLLAFFITIMLTPIVKQIAVKLGVVDFPGKRKVHQEIKPKLGGLAIFVGFLLAILVVNKVYGNLITRETLIILLGGIAVVILGGLDDAFNLQAPVKLLGQLIIAYAVVRLGIAINYFSNPFTMKVIYLGNWTNFISVIWILTLMNTINFMDGLDGLASGIVSISALSLFVISLILKQYYSAYLLIALAGAAIGFLRFNFNPASIFMGDTGSLFLGYILAVSAIQGVLKSSAAISLAIPLLSFLIPLGDMFMAIFRRIKNKKHIFRADNEHIHHKLLRIGFTHKQAVLIIYYTAILLNIMAVLLAFTSGVYSIILIVLIALVIIKGFNKIRRYFALA